jgi:hypothetical protein
VADGLWGVGVGFLRGDVSAAVRAERLAALLFRMALDYAVTLASVDFSLLPYSRCFPSWIKNSESLHSMISGQVERISLMPLVW